MTNTRDTPVEALERALPVRVRRYSIRRGSGGAGEHPGGDGIEREIEVLAPTTLSLITERRTSRPYGLAGGEPGASGENWLVPGGDEDAAERLTDKCTLHLAAGDVLRMLTPGGGGWGSTGSSPAPSTAPRATVGLHATRTFGPRRPSERQPRLLASEHQEERWNR